MFRVLVSDLVHNKSNKNSAALSPAQAWGKTFPKIICLDASFGVSIPPPTKF